MLHAIIVYLILFYVQAPLLKEKGTAPDIFFPILSVLKLQKDMTVPTTVSYPILTGAKESFIL